jgi:hypothetical protein
MSNKKTLIKNPQEILLSVEQKLISDIERECKLTKTLLSDDVHVAISNIRILIERYRQKYDTI